MAHTVTCHLRLLCLLKCLNTALKTKSQNYDPVSHISNSTVTTCADSTTEHSEDEGLGANI